MELAYITKTQRLEILKSEMRFKFSSDARRLVFMHGNPDAKLFFVGEAPGADEDKVGIPFVGRAGILLTELMHKAGIKREDVAIGNVMPFRPPNNRTPTPEEVALYLPYLIRQISIVAPDVVIPLGATAARVFLPNMKTITEARGISVLVEKYFVLPTYHPSYLLRLPPSERNVVVEDFKQALSLSAISWSTASKTASGDKGGD